VTGAERRARAEEMLDDIPAVFWDDCDDAIVGVARQCVVYDRPRLVAGFIAQGMSEEDAEEWVSFNIEEAYVGAHTPLLLSPVTPEWT
jgi:hypothetical protein